jgi:long-chain acyl-CoA synthetase
MICLVNCDWKFQKQSMTHPRIHAARAPNHPAIIMSDTGKIVAYGQMERRANQGAQLFRKVGIQTGDTIAVWLPSIPEYLCAYWAAQRAGLYITPIATALTAEEARYIVENSGAKLLISCNDIAGLAGLLSEQRPFNLQHYFDLADWNIAIAAMPDAPIADESAGFHMVYSSGTTGRPKGIRLPLTGGDPTAPHMLAERSERNYGVGPDTVYLSHRADSTLYVMPPVGGNGGYHAEIRSRNRASDN